MELHTHDTAPRRTAGLVRKLAESNPSVENFLLEMDVRYSSATTEVSVGLPLTAQLMNSIIRLNGFVSVPDMLITESISSDVLLNGSRVIPTIYAGDSTVQLSGGSLSVVIFDVPLTTNRTAIH